MNSDRNIKISKFLSLAQRHDVRLSEGAQVATLAGCQPVILRIASGRMNRGGHAFFRSPNGVWLTEQVPVKYTEFPVSETAQSA